MALFKDERKLRFEILDSEIFTKNNKNVRIWENSLSTITYIKYIQ